MIVVPNSPKYSSSFQWFMISQPYHYLFCCSFGSFQFVPCSSTATCYKVSPSLKWQSPFLQKSPSLFPVSSLPLSFTGTELNLFVCQVHLEYLLFFFFPHKNATSSLPEEQSMDVTLKQGGCEVVPAAGVNKLLWKRGHVWRSVMFTSHFRR